MTDKQQQFWMADTDGTRALVTGPTERDRLIPHGWEPAAEPGPGDFVWLEHDEHHGRAKFVAEAVPLWEASGWHPSPPAEPVNPALPNLAARAADVKPDTPAKPSKTEKE